MASHVVVLDSTARRAVVKVTSNTYLSDVLQEACKKLSCNASYYGLKNKDKVIDLSRTIRLAGLSSGAKLELTLLSRSPSVISVALQLPESEATDAPNRRLVDKFPSTTSLWLILRKFEAGVAGASGRSYNLTARGAPRIDEGDSGAGRLYYEMPVLQLMGRELSSISELQKTLGQLGFNSGSTLIRLAFKTTTTPLEEAMNEIGRFFKDEETDRDDLPDKQPNVETSEESSTAMSELNEKDSTLQSALPTTPGQSRAESVITQDAEDSSDIGHVPLPETLSSHQQFAGANDQRLVSVFAPPSHATPQAAQHGFDESDYEPTVEHAKLHQSRLSTSAQNVRLPSEAEIRAQEVAAQQRLVNTKEVELKIRYPDQAQLVGKFSATDTNSSLYDFVRSTIQSAGQPFSLSYATPKGPRVIPSDGPAKRLIYDLHLTGRVLVTFAWNEDASHEARSSPILKAEYASKAQAHNVDEIKAVDQTTDTTATSADQAKLQSSGTTTGRSKGVPKWLKLPGKR
ncbi:MAG: hypothetical protein M1825_004754 [Sarcosagium campestre]|nr:MAG: hypothetical protein M1825_004754 [Sarcosagium campestre]